MTLFTFKISLEKPKQIVVLLALVFCSNGLFAQLDSASVTLNITTAPDPDDSLSTMDVIEVEVYLDDIDFVGEVLVTMYEGGTDYPLMMQKFTKQQAIDNGLLSGDTITVPLYDIDSAEFYRIETQVRNYQGANLPMIISNYND